MRGASPRDANRSPVIRALVSIGTNSIRLLVLDGDRRIAAESRGTRLGAGIGETGTIDPADRVTLDETVSYAMLVVLESLTPAERTAWVLHDVFGMPFTEIAGVVGRTHQAVRQLAARANRVVLSPDDEKNVRKMASTFEPTPIAPLETEDKERVKAEFNEAS